jgi:predicted NBD/HSP70 family sugar kinase
MGAARRAVARGDLSSSAVLGVLGTQGPTSRADLARSLSISPATVTQLTRDLIDRGLVAELEHLPSHGGRPARLLGLVHSAGGAIGAKVTADHIAVVDAALDGTICDSWQESFDPDAPDALDRMCRVLGTAVDRHTGPLLGIGVGIPGSVDAQDSGIVDAPTLGWSHAPVGPVLRAALGVPVLVENDVNTLAVAERLYGTARDHGSYLVVTIGRGIGCGIVVDGALHRGAAGGAGEIGHVPVDPDGPPCTCGSRGCLEAFAGDAALLREAVAAGAVPAGADVEALRAAAAAGAAAALEVYHRAGEVLGRTLAGVVHTVDPEIVVLLGEGVSGWPFWQPGFEPAFRRHLFPARRGLPLVVESWDEDKWALGAAALVHASPFDAAGASGDQGQLVRDRLRDGGLHAGASS